MKLKIDITEKERHYLYRLIAVVLVICIFFMMIGCVGYLSVVWNVNGSWVYLIEAAVFWGVTIPVWKHYR